jgi:hypothetical protein
MDKQEIQDGIFLAGFLTKVVDGHVMTSILNTNETEAEIQDPIVELDEIDPTWHVNCAVKTKQKDREKNILEQLRPGHLNSEKINC